MQQQTYNPYSEVDDIRKRQNAELLAILVEEQAAEEAREEIMRGLQNSENKDIVIGAEERQRMKERFARERHEASNRLLRYTKAHEETLGEAVEAARKEEREREIEKERELANMM